jgi:peptide-methionine (S)-S-oxide reductase
MIRRVFLAGLAAVALSATALLASSLHGVAQKAAPGTAVATFAGGCFWCMEPPFDKTDGVLTTISGFMGGKELNPSYEQVASGRTGHTEVVQVTYDPTKVSYEKLLVVFWRNIDPLDAGGQFCDRGAQYRTGVFYHDEAQKAAALASKTKIDSGGQLKKPIVTEITAAGPFTAAEEYHQDFYKKNPSHYMRYRTGCGRDRRLEELWGKATQ